VYRVHGEPGAQRDPPGVVLGSLAVEGVLGEQLGRPAEERGIGRLAGRRRAERVDRALRHQPWGQPDIGERLAVDSAQRGPVGAGQDVAGHQRVDDDGVFAGHQ
jgi:hypothetical protein